MKIDENMRKSMKIRWKSMKINEILRKLVRKQRKSMEIIKKLMKMDENRWKSVEIMEKSMKIGAKGCPRRGTSHSGPRTADRDEAVGGGRGREVYLLNLTTRGLHTWGQGPRRIISLIYQGLVYH